MAYYLLGAIDIHNEEEYALYRASALPILAEDARVGALAIDGETTVFEGQQPGEHMFVIRFPNRAAVDAFLQDPRYRDAARHRRKGSTTHYIMGMEGRKA